MWIISNPSKLTSTLTVEAKRDICHDDCIFNFSSQTLGCDESQKENPQIGGKPEKQGE